MLQVKLSRARWGRPVYYCIITFLSAIEREKVHVREFDLKDQVAEIELWYLHYMILPYTI